MSGPMPPVKEYAPPTGRFFYYVWDTMGIPVVQEQEGYALITPTFDKLKIYGREVGSPYPEDQEGLVRLASLGRLMAECFSDVCPEGEVGSVPVEATTAISADEFSQAYQRGWL